MATDSIAVSKNAAPTSFGQDAVVVLGRLLFAVIFVMAGANHFSKQTIGYAASQGVPLASIAVPLSGVLAIVGGLSILLGYRAKLGAWLIVLFLIPVTVMMHKFWTVSDPMMAQIQMVMFYEKCFHARRRIVDFSLWRWAVQSGCTTLAVGASRTTCLLES